MLGVLINTDEGLVNAELSGENIVSFNIPMDSVSRFPVLWFLITVLEAIWKARTIRKPLSLRCLISTIESDLYFLKQTSFKDSAEIIESALNFIHY